MLKTSYVLADGLQRLTALVALKPERVRFQPPVTPEEINKAGVTLGAPLPEDWQAVLLIANGWECASDKFYTLIPDARSLSLSQKDTFTERYERNHPDIQAHYLYVGDSECGDLYCLDVLQEREHPQVVMFDHETTNIAMTWAGVGEFLQDIFVDAEEPVLEYDEEDEDE